MRGNWILVSAAVTLLATALFFALMRGRQKKNEYVIGEQFAAAEAAEQRRLKGNVDPSPMPDGGYDNWRGEYDLINPTRNSLDSSLMDLCQRFRNSDVQTRAKMRAAISLDEFYTLLTFSRRAAVFAVREHTVNWVINGLAAIAMIECDRIDFRDALVAISLLHHSATRIGENADQLLKDAATLSEAKVADLLIGFVRRPPEEKELRSSWGHDEVKTQDGIGFIGWEFAEYHPTLDLKSIVQEIADLISGDKYLAESVAVATELPSIWLQSKANPTVDKTLEAVTGGATIHARLRPNEHPTFESQMLLVFLVELVNESAAKDLLEMSKRKKPSDYCMSGVAEGRLFCLVVARSFVGGVSTFETPESLSRFTKGIAGILSRYAGKG